MTRSGKSMARPRPGPPQDAERLLDFIGDLHGALGLEAFSATLLDALSRLVPSDWLSLNEIVPEPGPLVFLSLPEAPAGLLADWVRLGHQNPLIERFRRTADGRPYRFSDVVSAKELQALELYREVYAPLGIEHQIAFVVRTEAERFLGLALSRGDRDYTDDERTAREAEVVAGLAVGESVGSIAEALGVTPRTVHKHLQRSYAKLGVDSRLQAARTAWKHFAVFGT